MKNAHQTATVITLFIYLIFATLSMAATNIDTSFGEDGITLQDFKIGNDEGYAIAVQSDGKILVTGYSSNGAVKDLIVSRFNGDGTLDPDFGIAGVYSKTLSQGNGDTIGRSLAIQKDGKIIVGASTYDGGAKVAVLRLTPKGNLDTTFTSDGYVVLPIENGKITSAAVQLVKSKNADESEDIIIAATMAPEDSASYAFFAKYLSNGILDTSFSDDGKASYSDGTNDVQINSLLILNDGKILSGGSFSEDGNNRAGLLQLTADGVGDTTYGVSGKLSIDLGGSSSVINSIAEDSDGNIIIAGSINNGEYDEAFIGKRTREGSAVSDFGTAGTYKTTYSLENVINAVSLTEDGSVLAVGFMTSLNGKDIFVLSLEESEETMTTAVTFLATDVAQNEDVAYAALALSNDSFLAAGSSSNGDDLDVALLRFTDNQALSAATPTESTNGIITSGYLITTSPVTSITRDSAVSGGTIRQLFKSNTDDDSSDAVEITITRKGVVFGTKPNPEYEEIEETEDTTSTTSETTTDTDTTTDTTGGIFPDSSSEGSIFPENIDYYIVRSGNTDDGEGNDSYTSEVENITPGTTYYLRAYAVLSDGAVIYGNEYTFATDDACFIATAAYGSIFEEHVVLLRQFRDSYLLTNTLGEHFVALYYSFSPPIADTIRDNNILKTIVKIGLFPAVLLAMFFVKTTLFIKMISLGAILVTTLLLAFKYFTFSKVSTT